MCTLEATLEVPVVPSRLSVVLSLVFACNTDALPKEDGPAQLDSGSADTGPGGDGTGSAGSGSDGEGPDGPAATALSCAPAVSRIESIWDAPGSVQFSATGEWSDGSDADVTAAATWSLGTGAGGSIDETGLYTAAARNAGPMEVEVAWEGLTARCSVDTWLEAVVDLTGDPALESAALAAVPRLDADCAPYVLYPYDQTRIPADFFSPEVQWIPQSGQDVFVVEFETDWIRVIAVTRDDAWTPSGDEWWAVADPGSGRDIDMTVLGGAWDPALGDFSDGLCGSPWTTALTTEWWGAPGAVFYWTPTTRGLWQIDIGASSAAPWVDESNTGACVGCHSSNAANPALFATARAGGGYGASVVADVTDPLVETAGAGRTAAFSTLNPTGTRLVRSLSGVLYLDDLSTNEQLSVVPTQGYATHPNWSPDGAWLAYSSCAGAHASEDWRAFDCDLRLLEVQSGDAWGADVSLSVAPPGHSHYYPEFSPDSQWVAFTRSTAGADSYDEPTAELMVVPQTGGRPILLAGANSLPNATNSWPRWGPIVGDIGWLAFSSRRPYALQTSGTHQVWVTGVDLAEVAAGRDGSAPPVWLPGQSTSTSNHTPAFVSSQFE